LRGAHELGRVLIELVRVTQRTALRAGGPVPVEAPRVGASVLFVALVVEFPTAVRINRLPHEGGEANDSLVGGGVDCGLRRGEVVGDN
jgi:hypothetical protein